MSEQDNQSSNPVLALMLEGQKQNWCMEPYCTTCGSHDYRKGLKAIAGSLGGPLANALSELSLDDVTKLREWRGAVEIALHDLPMAAQVEGVLRAWLPNITKHGVFADYILFRVVRHIPRASEVRQQWVDICLEMAVSNDDFSLIESLVLLLREDAKNFPALIEAATQWAKSSRQMRRVLINACAIPMKLD